MKMNVRNILILILSITIIIMGIGFVVLFFKLNSLRSLDNSFSVDFIKVRKLSSVKGGSVEPKSNVEISSNGKLINMDFTLSNENDIVTYEIVIKNTGNIDAEINELLMSPDYINDFKKQAFPITFEISDITGKVLEPDEETNVKLTVMYSSSPTKDVKNIKGKIGIIASK